MAPGVGLVERAFQTLHPFVSRLRTRKGIFILLTFTVALFFLYTTALGDVLAAFVPSPDSFKFSGFRNLPGFCTPDEFSAGRWVFRPWYTRPGPLTKTDLKKPQPTYDGPPINMTGPESVLKWARFKGCASSREFHWHLAANNEDHYKRFPGLLNWEWIPGGRCTRDENGLREFDPEEVVRELVEGGGWLMLGDSVTENQYYSLSCLLYPHVIATPDYTLSNWWERSWPQNMYLNPESPLLKDDDTIRIMKSNTKAKRKLNLPKGFNITGTPLVTFRRNDLLWSQDEIRAAHKELHPEFYEKNPKFEVFSEEESWTLSPDETLEIFFRELPEGNYKTLLANTAGHWTMNLFGGYRRPDGKPDESYGEIAKPGSKEPIYGYPGLQLFYKELMERFVDRLQGLIDKHSEKLQSYPPSRTATTGVVPQQKQVIVRSYLPGHVHCHDYMKPVTQVIPIKGSWWNWGEIQYYNNIFKEIVSRPKYNKNFHFLQIERPGNLRPDGHATSDCLHMMTGSGVMEGWNHYTWHYLTREISA